MMKKNVRDAENDCFYAVISYLNNIGDLTRHCYDCSPLGILHVWFHGYWDGEWYYPQPLPKEVTSKIIEGSK